MTGSHASAPRSPRSRLAAALARAGRGVHWYLTSLMGDRAYETYVAHLQRQHPEVAPLTERQFWRERMDEQSRDPGARCC